VSLLLGPAAVAGATAGAVATPGLSVRERVAVLVAVSGCGVVGWYDDNDTASAASKGLSGHLSALRRGEITGGLVKLVGIGMSGLAAGVILRREDASAAEMTLDALIDGALIAGSANLVNLLDLRPGRALKAVVLASAPALFGPAAPVVAAPIGAAAGLLPDDLSEQAMLGDCGANALGAALGVVAAARGSRGVRLGLLGGVSALVLASEKVSFTAVIEKTPALHRLDQLGRRPPGAARPPHE
jgi:UDP-N-acetylmuramyl pentapeptide phosphotransferase/UDP-N-acetylglucosamine-1-phosphate transferase